MADSQYQANHGTGRYRIYIGRQGVAKVDDHMTIRVSTDPNAPSDVTNPDNINLAKCDAPQPATDCTTVEVKSATITAAELQAQVAATLGVPLAAVEVKRFLTCQKDKRCAEICFNTVVIPPPPTATDATATAAATGATGTPTAGATTGTATGGLPPPTGEEKTATELQREFTFTVRR